MKGKRQEHTALSATAGCRVPSYSYEVHLKRRLLYLDVTLHRVPVSCIDVSMSKGDLFVLNTSKFTTKFHLEFRVPTGITLAHPLEEQSDTGNQLTLEHGILKCVFPIKEISKEYESTAKSKLATMRREKKVRLIDTPILPNSSTQLTKGQQGMLKIKSTVKSLDLSNKQSVTEPKKNKKPLTDNEKILSVLNTTLQELDEKNKTKAEMHKNKLKRGEIQRKKREVKKVIKTQAITQKYTEILQDKQNQLKKRMELFTLPNKKVTDKKVTFNI